MQSVENPFTSSNFFILSIDGKTNKALVAFFNYEKTIVENSKDSWQILTYSINTVSGHEKFWKKATSGNPFHKTALDL